jgi:release factor glutamine methyltransferase
MSSLNKLLYSEDSSIPILEKKILLKYILNTSDEEINISHNKPLDHIELGQYKALIQRRKKSEPIAYIINEKEFWKDTFFIDNSVLIPRPDSETIIETAIKYFPDTNQNLKMLDLGTGSGCLIISLLREFKNSRGIGIDFDKEALKVAKQNKSNLLNENRLKFCHADFSEFNTINYDLIVCNPPYVSTSSKDNILKDVQDFEPDIALFAKENGLRCFKMVLDNLIKYENKKQLIIFEIGYNQLKPIQKLLKNTGFQLISVEKDISDIPRCIVTKRI